MLRLSTKMNVLVDACPNYLGGMINLKWLKISYNYDGRPEESVDLLPWLVPSLACGTAPSPLEQLTLELETQFDTSDLDPLYENALWSDLDRILCSAAYPQFNDLKIFLTVRLSAGGDDARLIEATLASIMTPGTNIVVALELYWSDSDNESSDGSDESSGDSEDSDDSEDYEEEAVDMFFVNAPYVTGSAD